MTVDLRGLGGATFRCEGEKRGLEPDGCCKLGKLDDGEVPGIAVEATVSSALVDKMAVYAGLGVPEVWVWRAETSSIEVHCLAAGCNEPRAHSALLPALDLANLSRFARPGENQSQLAKAYQATLRNQ